MTDPTAPTVDMPLTDAIQELTGFESIGIMKHYGVEIEHLGGVRTLLGAVWAYENRRERTDWSTVERMTLRQLQGYFAAEDPDPDGEQGKGETPPADSPNS